MQSESSEYVLGTAQGDSLIMWDFRSTKTPIKTVGGTCVTGRIIDFDWLETAGDLIAVSDTCQLVKFSPTRSPIYIPSSDRMYGCLSLPSRRDTEDICVFATSCDDAVGVWSSNSGGGDLSKLGAIRIDHSTSRMFFLSENRMLCSVSTNSIYMHALHGLKREAVGGGDISPRTVGQNASSTTLHTTSSSGQIEVSGIEKNRNFFTLISRKSRRLGFTVSYDESSIELTLPVFLTVEEDQPDQEVRLKILMQAPDPPCLLWEVWWATNSGILPRGLPNRDNMVKFLPCIQDDNVIRGLHALKQFILQIYPPIPTEFNEVIGIPFPATCGVCWSPRGDLFRFQSLKGMSPFPSNREKLTMKNFMLFKNQTTSGGGGGSGAVSQMLDGGVLSTALADTCGGIRLNQILNFHEPLDSDDEEEGLEMEFSRRISIDQCVQYLPAAAFEETVEDHWFASIAPIVDLSESDCSIIARKIHNVSRELMIGDSVPEILRRWEVIATVFDNFTSTAASGMSALAASILSDEIKFLYETEHTQAVAILVAMMLKNLPKFSRPDITLHPSILLTLHDHAVLFQRLGCWETARVIEDLLDKTTRMPLMADPQTTTFKSPLGRRSQDVCCICDLHIIGLSQICRSCGHGGHMNHIKKYFSTTSSKCPHPTCDCECGVSRRKF